MFVPLFLAKICLLTKYLRLSLGGTSLVFSLNLLCLTTNGFVELPTLKIFSLIDQEHTVSKQVDGPRTHF